tara:strand:+ start:1083 stop:1433 length:351 start_codon:yes stop_codon:yes gene_type:complete
MNNPVSNPEHYLSAGLSPQALIEAWDLLFAEGNVIKYVTRARHKGKEREDLKKAVWYALRAYENCCAKEDGRDPIDIDDKEDPHNPFGLGFLGAFEQAQANVPRDPPVASPPTLTP